MPPMPPHTVLIIDDEESIRNAVHATLEDCGYIVLEAPDGQTGLDLISREPDRLVVLLDLMLPSLSGLKLLQAVGQNPDLAARHVFILFTAARAFTAHELRSYLPNRRLLNLPKPFSIEQLIQVVEEAVREGTDAGAEESSETAQPGRSEPPDPRLD